MAAKRSTAGKRAKMKARGNLQYTQKFMALDDTTKKLTADVSRIEQFIAEQSKWCSEANRKLAAANGQLAVLREQYNLQRENLTKVVVRLNSLDPPPRASGHPADSSERMRANDARIPADANAVSLLKRPR